ncbi:MAG: hypothetical protein HY329_01060 [Chloroflexi bacterium]|nr:hypothetical protein [Chloroflexota bacterium]
MVRQTSSGSNMGFMFILVACGFIVGPILISSLVNIPTGSQLMLMTFGVLLLIVGLVIVTITRLYHRAPADRAFVRTGMGGPRVVIDGGALVIPVVHELIPVSLRTMRLTVTRNDNDALLTKDRLRADVTAEFFIKVPKERESVLAAATSLGSGAENPDLVSQLIGDKLVSALRQVAAEMSLPELQENRQQFIERVMSHVKSDIARNGLELESVTISRLDQTRADALRGEDNIFDAQGARAIAEIVSTERVKRTHAQLDAEREIKQRTVETNKFLYDQDVANETAQAERDQRIQIAKATAAREAATSAAEQARLSGLAEVHRDQAVQVAQTEMAKAVDVAAQQREQAVKTAELIKMRSMEVTERENEIAVAQKTKELAEAEALRLAAQAEAERRKQEITTVEVTAEAERRARQATIAAQAEADKQRISKETEATVGAFTVRTQAEAEQEAAAQRAQARLTLARAEKDSAILEAEGDQARQIVPVKVAREQVDVDSARVEVKRQDLAVQSENQAIAMQKEIALAQIDADKQVRIAQAEAMAMAFNNARITVWGDPTTVTRMSEAFYRGQQNGYVLDGLAAATPPEVKQAASGLGAVLAAIAKEKLGISVDPAVAENLLREYGASAPNDGVKS